MKKFLSFMLVGLFSLVAANAMADSLNGKIYTIHNAVSTGAYLQDNLSEGDVIDAFALNSSSYWRFIATGNENCYYIKNVATGRYIQSYGPESEVDVTLGTSPAEYYVAACDEEGGLTGSLQRLTALTISRRDVSASTSKANHMRTSAALRPTAQLQAPTTARFGYSKAGLPTLARLRRKATFTFITWVPINGSATTTSTPPIMRRVRSLLHAAAT